jgi:hypothetical protein
MKQSEYVEGKQAAENFEEGMKAIFKVPKEKVAKVGKKLNPSRPSRTKKPKRADEN